MPCPPNSFFAIFCSLDLFHKQTHFIMIHFNKPCINPIYFFLIQPFIQHVINKATTISNSLSSLDMKLSGSFVFLYILSWVVLWCCTYLCRETLLSAQNCDTPSHCLYLLHHQIPPTRYVLTFSGLSGQRVCMPFATGSLYNSVCAEHV